MECGGEREIDSKAHQWPMPGHSHTKDKEHGKGNQASFLSLENFEFNTLDFFESAPKV